MRIVDTDSVIFHSIPGLDNTKIGFTLGAFTSELEDGDTIREFVCTAPKAYSYRTEKVGGKRCVIVTFGSIVLQGYTKVAFKGITLRGECERVVTLDSMRAIVNGEMVDERVYERVNNPIVRHRLMLKHRADPYRMHVPHPLILKNRATGELRSADERTKRVRTVMTKRVFAEDNTSTPFGYDKSGSVLYDLLQSFCVDDDDV